MANPRKFSEKIALQKQKQAEGTAEFEKIMKEVYATKMDDGQTSQQHITEDIAHSPGGNSNAPYREGRGRSIGVGPMRRPSDRKDRSPYSSANIAFLSPPSDSSWRRANSDSAIHQSLQATQERHHGSHSLLSQCNASHRRSASTVPIPNSNSNSDCLNLQSISPTNRNSSNVELHQPFQYNSSLYKSIHDSTLYNPMANTGSLPDLTSVHFSPINQPQLEKEPQNLNSPSSPFSSGQLTTPPTMISPTAVSSNRYHCSPAHSPSDTSNFSPTHCTAQYSQVQDNTQFSQYRQAHNDQQQQHHQPQQHLHQNTAHLSFPNIPGLSQQHSNQPGNVRNLNISSNSTIHGSHGHLSSIGITPSGNLTDYRNSSERPSPGSSPGLLSNTRNHPIYSPGSPVYDDKSSEAYSKQGKTSNDGYGLNPAFQNHFEQFSLVDNTTESSANTSTAQNNLNEFQFDTALLNRLVNNTASNVEVPQFQQQQQSQQQSVNESNDGQNHCNSNERSDINVLSLLGGNLRLSNGGQSPSSGPQESQNTPRVNTPTTIPEIVFSDFSSNPPDFTREIFSSLDYELGAIDLQMLSDPSGAMIADPITEDSFRRDLT